ncbi:MAG TPA: proline--tRNA ligase [Mycobacteriales bacterium]|jgi:prolyl-tRNA synthetase|nr:proline--tRNA ligase [Mycobacteriales bacterium]
MAIARMSSLFLRTLRDDPADAELPSHRLMVRAGYIRRVSLGVYSWMPLGKKMLDNVAAIVREEMERIGGQEVLFPAIIPREIFEASGRYDDYGDAIFRMSDRKGVDYLLAPTHEELFTLMVKGELSSYRDYPVTLFQIQTKYRDEARPRAGLLRGREFVMKDSYSFDLDDDGFRASYEAHRGAYRRIFDRLGLDYRIAFATSGAMGGSASEEFLAPADNGEDTFVQCANCDYTANTEAVEIAVPDKQDPSGHPEMRVLDTPGTPTIETLVQVLNDQDLGRTMTAADTLKNVVLKTRAPGQDWELLIVGVPGDRDVDLKRIAGQFEPVLVEVADKAALDAHPELTVGYIGPQRLAEWGIRYVVDPTVVPGSAWVTGANEPDRHAAFVVRGRDFEPAGELGAVEIRDGDHCSRCGGELSIARGIEIGHIFQLGRKFTNAFELDATGADGEPIRITMGSYGVGVSRAVAAVAEQTLDSAGLCWPASITPYDVHIVPVGRGDEQLTAATALAEQFEAAGARVLLDDRDASAGEKFADADLIGVPTIVVVGKGLVEGNVEVKDRRSGERRVVALDAVVGELSAA